MNALSQHCKSSRAPQNKFQICFRLALRLGKLHRHADGTPRKFTSMLTLNPYRAAWIARLLLLGVLGNVQFVRGAEADPPAAQAPHADNAQTFSVHEYRVLGNTVLDSRTIEGVLYPLLGENKTLDDVQAARTALEEAYHSHGFGTVFVDIPPQSVDEGIVRLRVTEGRLRQTSISGARYFSERQILADMPAAAAGTVPNLPQLQQQLAAVNAQTTDRSVVPVLKAGPTPGTVDLALKVADELPLHGSIELNNQFAADTKPLRAIVGLSYSNLFGELDNLAAQYQVAPQDASEVTVYALSYTFRPLANGLRASAYFIESDSDIAAIGTIGVLGKGKIGGTKFSFPLESAAGSTQSLTLGVDYKDFSQVVNLSGGTPLDTPVSYTIVSAAYLGTWTGSVTQVLFSASANFGPRGLPNDISDFANARFKGNPNFFYLRFDGSYNLKLPLSFRLLLRAAGQLAAEPLVNNEDYSIAGADGVRGYVEAEELGDRAIKSTFQLYSPPLIVRKFNIGSGFAFFDAARADIIDSLPEQAGHVELRSW
jgi:hemolysin activation/secretion protein